MPDQSERKILWVNWHTLMQDEVVIHTDQGDTRTAMYCRADAQDITSYINYVKVCSVLRNKLSDMASPSGRGRRIVGPDYMFDLGFLPITMTPSYWDPAIADKILHAVQDRRIPAYPRPHLGLSDYTFYSKNTASLPEWWVAKSDIAAMTGKSIDRVGLKEVFDLCGLSHL